jgi:hypothetical protein
MNDNRIKPEHRDRAKHLVKLIEVRYGTYSAAGGFGYEGHR